MITWAALLVLQGVEGGVGEPDGRSILGTIAEFIITDIFIQISFSFNLT
jgi:hypothetical protein